MNESWLSAITKYVAFRALPTVMAGVSVAHHSYGWATYWVLVTAWYIAMEARS